MVDNDGVDHDGVDTRGRQKRWRRLDATGTHVADRTLACCIPLRLGNLEGTGPRVLMVTSRSSQKNAMKIASEESTRSLVFPKGGWEDQETVYEAAEREAFEEAGVGGRLEIPHFAVFEYDSDKEFVDAQSDNGVRWRNRIVYVYVLHVEVEYDEWPEKDARDRYWMDVKEAGTRLKHDWMRAALEELVVKNRWTDAV